MTAILGAAFLSGTVLAAGQGIAHSTDHGHEHSHAHEHDHQHGQDAVYRGHFDEAQVQSRELTDWEGDWQSVYPLLKDGTLAPVMAHKAKKGEKTAEQYAEYYEIGYRTDVERIVIKEGRVTFYRDGGALSGHYVDDGHEILTYKAGNRGVRYIFRKASGDSEAPAYIQFSDHAIAPTDAGHFHLYWGDDRARLLDEVTNWPTYYPSVLSGGEILEEMLAH
ncbi:ZinT family metal-binding protein [Paracoccus ravus]|uniref:ZinT family metal-binding protein n=1 Tax=Paracoccus ravus TaxID=2447760 RepID=UPI001ADD4FB5|nr:metal-binding protein ZinT [Paracoccus ravus]